MRFSERTAQLPAQERMARLGDGLGRPSIDWRANSTRPPRRLAVRADLRARHRRAAGRRAAVVPGAGLSSQLARVALLAGDPPTAERLLRAALQTDPRQPAARALLALAVLAQGHDASAEIAAASAETQDELGRTAARPAPPMCERHERGDHDLRGALPRRGGERAGPETRSAGGGAGNALTPGPSPNFGERPG